MRSARRGLARYLVRTYLLLALLVGGVLTWVSIWSVNTLEVHLQRIDMGMAVERVRSDFLAGIDPGRPHRFFHGEPGSAAFPQDVYKRQVPGCGGIVNLQFARQVKPTAGMTEAAEVERLQRQNEADLAELQALAWQPSCATR